MENTPTIKSRIEAMKQIHDEGIRTTCFISPIFPGITDVFSIIEEIKDFCDYIWLENLNLRGSFKGTIMNYIKEKYPTFKIKRKCCIISRFCTIRIISSLFK